VAEARRVAVAATEAVALAVGSSSTIVAVSLRITVAEGSGWTAMGVSTLALARLLQPLRLKARRANSTSAIFFSI
jgi:predicted S18 family serine protease